MKRKTKKTKKTPAKTTAITTKSNKEIPEKTETDSINCQIKIENISINKNDDDDFKITQQLKLPKAENIDYDNVVLEQEPCSSPNVLDTQTTCFDNSSDSFVVDSKAKFVFIELKLISIDSKCVEYGRLEERFLCVDTKSIIEQIKKFILKKMNIADDLFEIAVMCNGFEVKSKCPIVFLKDRFFKDKEVIVLYYAIIESNFKMPNNSNVTQHRSLKAN